MPEFAVPPDASIATAHAWFGKADLFGRDQDARLRAPAGIQQPIPAAMVGAWTAWHGSDVILPNVATVRTQRECTTALETISTRLNLQADPESYAAFRFCLGELTRNVLEHANSPQGAFVSSGLSEEGEPGGVVLAVADCGQGIPVHIARAHPDVRDDLTALGLSMRPGVTGAQPGFYGGTPDNAGAGLYITRSIAKASGGSFFLASGNAAYRVRRARSEDDMMELFVDPFDDPQADHWTPDHPWVGTVAAVEIRTDTIAHFENLVEWVLKQVPVRTAGKRRIRFT